MARGSPQTQESKQQTVFLFSPQPWDGIMVSKHHYGIALAAAGYEVFFIEPPNASLPHRTISLKDSGVARLKVVRYAPWFPYRIKFHHRGIFDMAMRRQAQLLRQAIGRTPDLVWDFDNAWQFATLRIFGARHNILHLVDYFPPRLGHKDADLVVLLAENLGEGEWGGRVPLLIGHCLGADFSALAQRVLASPERTPEHVVRAAYMGDLNDRSIDWEVFWALVEAHPEVEFHFVGPGPELTHRADFHAGFAARVIEAPNVRLPGVLLRQELVRFAETIDVWLYAIDRALDANKGADSHKMLEYLATGSVCVASRLEAHAGSTLLMMTGQTHNRELPELFSYALENLESLNCVERRRARASHSLGRSYPSAIDTILRALDRATADEAFCEATRRRAATVSQTDAFTPQEWL